MNSIPNNKDLDNRFTYHPPHGDQATRYHFLRCAARQFAEQIASRCPESRERSLAFRKIQEAVMWANASIACNEPRVPGPPNPPRGVPELA